MLRGFDRLAKLASKPELIVPGHDPIVCTAFDRAQADHIVRLDLGPVQDVPVPKTM